MDPSIVTVTMEEKKIFKCKLCNLPFDKSQNLAVHAKLDHKNEEYPTRYKKRKTKKSDVGGSSSNAQPPHLPNVACLPPLGALLGNEKRKTENYQGGGSSSNAQPPSLPNVVARPLPLRKALGNRLIEARPHLFKTVRLVPVERGKNDFIAVAGADAVKKGDVDLELRLGI